MIISLLVCVFVALNVMRLRGRLRRLAVAPASGRPVSPSHAFLVAAGVDLPDATRRAASEFASAAGLEVCDLVPDDLTTGRTLDLARRVETRTYRGDRLTRGKGACQAILAERYVLDRARIEPAEGLRPAEMVAATEKLKRYACATTDLVAVPGITSLSGTRAPATPLGETRARIADLRAASHDERHRVLFAPLRDLLVLIALLQSWQWGLVAVAVVVLAPVATCAGRLPVRPRDLVRSSLTRVLVPYVAIELAVRNRLAQPDERAAWEDEQADQARRTWYSQWIDAGVDGLLESPRPDCPWCGGTRLSHRITTGDVVMAKPGSFRYDRCDTCEHIFQNPRLTPAGLDFYYRDCYDGLGAETTENLFAFSAGPYRSRAAMVAPHTTPRAWLDVGGGHGHFCAVAREVFPTTRFDALDQSDAIAEAEARRWVDHGYQAMFPDVAGMLADRYDVISMFHYLEHTRNPAAELDAAAKALLPGGYLFIEVPNAHSPSGRLYGKWWTGWFAPQHQHFVPAGNLLRALEDRGLQPVQVDFSGAHQIGHGAFVAYFMLQRLQPDPALPWLPYSATPSRRLRRALAVAVTVPLLAPALLVDAVTMPYLKRGERSNAYRVLARKPDPGEMPA